MRFFNVKLKLTAEAGSLELSAWVSVEGPGVAAALEKL